MQMSRFLVISSQNLKYFISPSLCLHGFWGEPSLNSYLFSFISCAFLWLSPKLFPLSLIFCGLNMLCLNEAFSACILPVVLWASWLCGLASDSNLGQFWVIIISSTVSVCSSLPFFSSIPNIHIPQVVVVLVLRFPLLSCFFQSFFSLLFSFKSLYYHIFKLRDFFP